MKKIITIMFLCMSVFSVAQNCMDSLENTTSITSVVVDREMISLMNKMEDDLDESPDYKAFINAVSELKVYECKDKSKQSLMERSFLSCVSMAGLKKLVTVNDSQSDIRFYSKPGSEKGRVSALAMYVNEKNNKGSVVVLFITGDFKLVDLAKLSSIITISGNEYFSRVN